MNWIHSNHVNCAIIPIHLSQPHFLAIEVLPREYRSRVIENISKALKVIPPGKQIVLRNHLESMIKNLSLDNEFDHEFEHFLEFTADFDQRTKTSFRHHNSRLWNKLNNHHREIYNHYVQTPI